MTGTPASRAADYLEKAERRAGRPLGCRDDVLILLRVAADPALRGDFDRALFLAKFWEGAMGILRRTGPGAEDVQKLTGEIAEVTARLSTHLTTMAEAVAPGAGEEFRLRYFSLDASSLGRLRLLLSDLALLKNFELHGGADR